MNILELLDFFFADIISENNDRIYMVGVVNDCFKRRSRNGNQYAKIEMSDELGFLHGMLMDTQRQAKLTEFLQQNNNTLPKKESVIYIEGRKSDDIVFIELVNESFNLSNSSVFLLSSLCFL